MSSRSALILFFILLIFSTGCNLFKRTPDSPERDKRASARVYKKYSEKFGYNLEGTESRNLLKSINSWLGVPYEYAGCSKKGVDCSCLIKNIYKEIYGVELPRRSVDMAKKARKISKRNLQEGDLLFFKISGDKVSHVGLYISKGNFVHASSSNGVMINNLNEQYYKKAFNCAGRVKKE